jgi:hypothetical protein
MLRRCFESSLAIAVALWASLASAAIIFNGNLTDTSQIRSASNSPYFPGGQTDVVGVSFHYGNTVASGNNVQGIFFDNIDLDPNGSPYALAANGTGPTLSVSGISSFTSRERAQSLDATGPNDTVLETVANQMYYISANETVTMTFTGLAADANYLVQAIGGDSGAGWTGQFRVTANGSLVGDWTTVTDEVKSTASLFAFDTTASPTGALVLDLNVFTGTYAALSGLIISQEVIPAPEPGTGFLLGMALLWGTRWRKNRIACVL